MIINLRRKLYFKKFKFVSNKEKNSNKPIIFITFLQPFYSYTLNDK